MARRAGTMHASRQTAKMMGPTAIKPREKPSGSSMSCEIPTVNSAPERETMAATLLDSELMPWSAKAIELVRQQYAAVGTAARVGLEEPLLH
jgi:hypothetical protein